MATMAFRRGCHWSCTWQLRLLLVCPAEQAASLRRDQKILRGWGWRVRSPGSCSAMRKRAGGTIYLQMGSSLQLLDLLCSCQRPRSAWPC